MTDKQPRKRQRVSKTVIEKPIASEPIDIVSPDDKKPEKKQRKPRSVSEYNIFVKKYQDEHLLESGKRMSSIQAQKQIKSLGLYQPKK